MAEQMLIQPSVNLMQIFIVLNFVYNSHHCTLGVIDYTLAEYIV